MHIWIAVIMYFFWWNFIVLCFHNSIWSCGGSAVVTVYIDPPAATKYSTVVQCSTRCLVVNA